MFLLFSPIHVLTQKQAAELFPSHSPRDTQGFSYCSHLILNSPRAVVVLTMPGHYVHILLSFAYRQSPQIPVVRTAHSPQFATLLE